MVADYISILYDLFKCEAKNSISTELDILILYFNFQTLPRNRLTHMPIFI